MSDNATLRSRALFIGLCIILMATVIFLFGKSLSEETGGTLAQETPVEGSERVPQVLEPAQAFTPLSFSIGNQPAGTNGVRTLPQFYERGAYPGAPPRIPHAVSPDMQDAFASCLTCHEQGGFVAKFKAYAPISPHPDMHNCQQCHVPEQTTALFQDSDWQSVTPPARGKATIPGGPFPIPHSLQMRENCLACHGGAAAIKEIKSGHPERVNCQQCHVPRQPDFFRNGSGS